MSASDRSTIAVVVAFDLASAAMFLLMGGFLAGVISLFVDGVVRAHRAQTPLDMDPSTLNEVRVACFGQPGGPGSWTNAPMYLVTVTRSAVTIESLIRVLPPGPWVIRREDRPSFRTRERITKEVVDDTTGRWLGFFSPLRAGQVTAALWAHGWHDGGGGEGR